MKVLVSGAAGYIGSEIMKSGHQAGFEMFGFDNFDSTLYSSEEKVARSESLKQLGLDVRVFDPASSPMSELQIEEFDVLINEMAIPGLAPSWTHFDKYVSSNVIGFQAILQAVKLRNPKLKIVHASTSSVYGNSDGKGSLSPISPYGVTKLAAENLLRSYATALDLEYAILRYFSIYGKIQRPDMAYSRFIKKILHSEPITIFGDGKQSRSNTHVSDVVSATLAAAASVKGAFTADICGAEQIKLLDAIRIIEEEIGAKAEIVFADRQDGDQRFSMGDGSHANRILGWEPRVKFDDGIREQVHLTRSKLGI